MTYYLGIDLGTTYTAAALWRDGRLEMVELGTRSTTVPSVLYRRDDGDFLVGEAAVRRSFDDPDRVAREFKRRFGDDTPLLLAGAPFSAEALTGELLRWSIGQARQREGSAPAGMAVTYPANWGPFRRELLEGVVREARVVPSILVPEPVAAVAHYASANRVPDGGVVAVYDLGGGTFDAAVVRKTATGFDLLGRPEGIEHLGGVDIDVAVFSHVLRSVGLELNASIDGDPALFKALIRLRADCVEAKEVLSADTEVEIPVQLPSVTTRVRLTRAELETMIRPPIQRTIDGLLMALASAGVTADQLDAVLLVGGSSRVPLVGQLVTEALGRPVAVDAHPKHPVAMGAALLLAAGQTASSPGTIVVSASAEHAPPLPTPPQPPPHAPPQPPPLPTPPQLTTPPRQPPASPRPPSSPRPQPVRPEAVPVPQLAVPAPVGPAPPVFRPAPVVAHEAGVGIVAPVPTSTGRPVWLVPAAISAVVALLAVIGWRVLAGGDDASQPPTVTQSTVSVPPTQATTPPTVTQPLLPLPEPVTLAAPVGIDATLGRGAAAFKTAVARSNFVADPNKAPVVLAVETRFNKYHGGIASFREGAQFINTRLGGFGADPAAGVAGAPVQIVDCGAPDLDTAGFRKADEVKACTEKLLAQKPLASIQGFNDYAVASIDRLRSGGVVNHFDWKFNYQSSYPQRGVVALTPLTCWSLNLGMAGAAIEALGPRATAAVLYQPDDGCERTVRNPDIPTDNYIDAAREAGLNVIIEGPHEVDAVGAELLDKLKTQLPDAVLMHYGPVCPSLVAALAPVYAASGKILTVMTTGCGDKAFPTGVNIRIVQMHGRDCAGEASRLGLDVALFGQACQDTRRPADSAAGGQDSLTIGQDTRIGLEPLLVLWAAASELARLNPTNPAYGALSSTIAHNGSWFVFGREPLTCDQFKTLVGQCVVPIFSWPFGQEAAERRIDLNAVVPKR